MSRMRTRVASALGKPTVVDPNGIAARLPRTTRAPSRSGRRCLRIVMRAWASGICSLSRSSLRCKDLGLLTQRLDLVQHLIEHIAQIGRHPIITQGGPSKRDHSTRST